MLKKKKGHYRGKCLRCDQEGYVDCHDLDTARGARCMLCGGRMELYKHNPSPSYIRRASADALSKRNR